MYGALWRMLPGPAWLRVVLLVLLATAVVAVCVVWVFPWIEHEFVQLPEIVEEGP